MDLLHRYVSPSKRYHMLSVRIMLIRGSLFLFLLFFPSATSLAPLSKPRSQPTFRSAIIVFLICVLHAFVIFIVSAVMIYRFPPHLAAWAQFLGVQGTILAAIQFLPQIWTTWKLQAVESLSIPMMCIQTPGSFVWVASLAANLGWEGWSTWGIYLVTGILQGCLLMMGITFEIRDRRNSKVLAEQDDGSFNQRITNDEAAVDHERTALLSHER